MSLLEEIARRSGVSKITVSRVLNGDTAYIRPTFARRAEHIRALAAQLGYRPNSAARAISTGRFDCVGLLVRKDGALPPCLLRALSGALAAQGRRLLLSELPAQDIDGPQQLPRLLRELCVDGLLVQVATPIPEATSDRIRRDRVPTVWMNVRHDADCVHPDDDEAARRLVRTIAAAGHRRIAYFSTCHGWRELADLQHYSVHARAAGHQAALAEAGLPAKVVRSDATADLHATRALALEMLSARGRPTAVVTYRSAEAGAVFAAANLLGLRVPGDLLIATYVDGEAASGHDETGLPLLLAQVPLGSVGERAAAMLGEKLADPARALPAQAVRFGELVGAVPGPAR